MLPDGMCVSHDHCVSHDTDYIFSSSLELVIENNGERAIEMMKMKFQSHDSRFILQSKLLTRNGISF